MYTSITLVVEVCRALWSGVKRCWFGRVQNYVVPGGHCDDVYLPAWVQNVDRASFVEYSEYKLLLLSSCGSMQSNAFPKKCGCSSTSVKDAQPPPAWSEAWCGQWTPELPDMEIWRGQKQRSRLRTLVR